MKNKPELPMKENTKKTIKVQLDYRTIVTIKNMEKLKFWQLRYPEAKIITA